MFLSKPGTYKPCGVFNIKHLIMFLITVIGIAVAVKHTKVKQSSEIKKIIRNLTIVVWILEILKIIFVFSIGEGKNLNRVLPLYYCSLLLYAGLLSSVGKGFIERMGNVFLATGGIVGGLVFIIYPSTSLPEYPVFHFISFHSFLYHGIMIYIGIIINKFEYIKVKMSDLKYYAGLIFVICVIAYIVNSIFGSNLMFISQDFPGMPISVLYHWAGKLFTPLMVIIQMVVPFLIVYGFLKARACTRQFKSYAK